MEIVSYEAVVEDLMVEGAVGEGEALDGLKAMEFVVANSLFDGYIDFARLEIVHQSPAVDLLSELKW
jgi:hypothetical protein